MRQRVRVASLHGGQSRIVSVVFAHDGTKLVTADADGRVLVWEWPGGRLLREFPRQYGGVFAVAFTLDDRFIASSGGDPEIRLVDSTIGVTQEVYLGHNTVRVWGLTFGPDAGTILSAGGEGTARIWDVHDRHIRTVLTTPASGCQYAFSKDGRGLTSIGANFVVSTWDLSTGAPCQDRALDVPEAMDEPILNADGTIAAVMRKDGVIEIWDLLRWRRRDTIGPIPGLEPRGVFDPMFDPTERIFALHMGEFWSFLDLSKHKIVCKQQVHLRAFSPEGEAILEGPGYMFRVNLESKRMESIPALIANKTSCTFSADGTLMVTGHQGRSVQLWNWSPLVLRGELLGHGEVMTATAFSPDNRTLATGDAAGVVKLWDIATGEELLTLEPHAGPIGPIRFSPDGRTLAVSSAGKPGDAWTITLWHTAADGPAVPTAAGAQL